jgi:hypothetical protein
MKICFVRLFKLCSLNEPAWFRSLGLAWIFIAVLTTAITANVFAQSLSGGYWSDGVNGGNYATLGGLSSAGIAVNGNVGGGSLACGNGGGGGGAGVTGGSGGAGGNGSTSGGTGGLGGSSGVGGGSAGTTTTTKTDSTSAVTNITSGASVSITSLGITYNPVLAGGTLVLNTGNSSSTSISVTSAGGVIQSPTSGSATLSGALTGSGALTFTGTGATVLTGTNTYTGGTTFIYIFVLGLVVR